MLYNGSNKNDGGVHMYVIGIDGGGTNSRAVLCDEMGRVYAFTKAGPVNQNSVSIEKVASQFQLLIQNLRQQAPEYFQQVTYVFAGVAGTGKEEARLRIQEILEDIKPFDASMDVKHDGYNALYAGTLGEPGVVQISGTGSLTFGMNAQGNTARAGGWGYLIGDEGSGYAIGRDALSAMAKAHDGWGEPTSLSKYILNQFEVKNPHDIIPHIYNQSHPRQHIANLSRYVMDAAINHDSVAQDIIHKAAHDLSEQIRAVVTKLFDKHQKVPVVLTGGVFTSADLIIPSIDQTFDQYYRNIDLLEPKITPLGGAVIAAIRASDRQVNSGFVDQFMQAIRDGLA